MVFIFLRGGASLVTLFKIRVYFIFLFVFYLFIFAFFILNTGIFFPCFFDSGKFFYQNNSLTLSCLMGISSIYLLFY
jgi:hypothetical protein